MIPPVSGGAGSSSERGSGQRILELRDDPFTTAILGELADRLAVPEDGAFVGFLGRTRSTPGTPAPGQEAEAARHAGRAVEALDYEAHETMALRVLDGIADEIATRFGVDRIAIVHRLGEVPLGEPSIAVVAAAPHRDAAFAAARYAIDETKARAPIWKAERFRDGHVWIGHQARTAAEPQGDEREGVPERRHGGDRRGQPSGTHRPEARSISRGRRADDRRDQRRDRGRARRRRHGRPRQRQPRRDVQPAARIGSIAPPACSRARSPGRWSPGAGPDAGFGVALFVGYHARAGHPTGTIAHTYSGAPVETRLDGRPTGEYGLNAVALAAWGDPGRSRGRRRRARGRGRVLAAVGRACRGQGGGRRACRRVRSTRRSPPTSYARARSARSGVRSRASWSSCGSARPWSSRSTSRAASRPTSPRSSRAPSGSAIGASGSRSDDPLAAYRGFLAGNRLAGAID